MRIASASFEIASFPGGSSICKGGKMNEHYTSETWVRPVQYNDTKEFNTKQPGNIMRKILLTTALLLGLALQPLKALDASISYATFKSESGSYVELYLHFAGSTVTFLPEGDSTMRAVLNVLILFRQDSQIVKFDKYRLNSPFFQSPADFVDLKRYSLPNCKYTLEITVEDNALAGNKANFSTDFTVDFPASGLSMSDIQLLASCKPVEAGSDNPMVKSGFCFEPLPYNFYGRSA